MIKNKFFIAGIISLFFLIVLSGYFIWNRYLNPLAQQERESARSYQLVRQWEESYRKMRGQDDYGGATPAETLQMFLTALNQNDFNLAVKYIYQGTGASDYRNRELYYEGFRRLQKEGRLQETINLIKSATEDPEASLHGRHKVFAARAEDGLVLLDVHFFLHELSDVWKIQSIH